MAEHAPYCRHTIGDVQAEVSIQVSGVAARHMRVHFREAWHQVSIGAVYYAGFLGYLNVIDRANRHDAAVIDQDSLLLNDHLRCHRYNVDIHKRGTCSERGRMGKE